MHLSSICVSATCTMAYCCLFIAQHLTPYSRVGSIDASKKKKCLYNLSGTGWLHNTSPVCIHYAHIVLILFAIINLNLRFCSVFLLDIELSRCGAKLFSVLITWFFLFSGLGELHFNIFAVWFYCFQPFHLKPLSKGVTYHILAFLSE